MGICYNLKALLIMQFWLVGETVNSLAFHASIHGFESRTRHHLNHTSHMNLCEFLFVVYKRHTLYGWLRTIFCVVCFFMCLRTGWDNTWFLFFTFLNIKNEPYDVTLTLGNKSHNIPSQLLYVCFQKRKYISPILLYKILLYLSIFAFCLSECPWTFFFHVHRGYIMVINGMKSGFLFEIDVFPTFSVQNIL